eukprot:5551884-Prymnesium_polylepis.1
MPHDCPPLSAAQEDDATCPTAPALPWRLACPAVPSLPAHSHAVRPQPTACAQSRPRDDPG